VVRLDGSPKDTLKIGLRGWKGRSCVVQPQPRATWRRAWSFCCRQYQAMQEKRGELFSTAQLALQPGLMTEWARAIET